MEISVLTVYNSEYPNGVRRSRCILDRPGLNRNCDNGKELSIKKKLYNVIPFYVTLECQTFDVKMKSHKCKIFTHVRPQETGVNIVYCG
jgi:hypothetical protein